MKMLWHRHKWTAHDATITEVWGDGWGETTKYPRRCYTDISGICGTCQAPLHRRIDGVWTMPEGGA